MSFDNESRPSVRTPLKAVCFDFRGVILDHKTNESILFGMEGLLKKLKDKGLILALVSHFPTEVIIGLLGSMQRFFGSNIYSGGGEGKLNCIRRFARSCGIDNLAHIAFVDDKPDNILPVALESDAYAIGFQGSGKYPQARNICLDQGIAYAENVKELENLLLAQTNA